MATNRFFRSFEEESRSSRILRRAVLLFIAVHIPLAIVSGYRAIVQVKSLELTATERTLRDGTTVRADVVSSARVHVTLRIEMIQGARVDTLDTTLVPKNRDAAYDPRSRRASLSVVLTPATLSRFQPGPVILRAIARGRPQWLREPPPTVREIAAELPAMRTTSLPSPSRP